MVTPMTSAQKINDERVLFTIGYGGRDPGQFVEALKDNGVKTVVDVRLRPDRAFLGVFARVGSSDNGIEKLLSSAGIGYLSIPELGNPYREEEDWREPYKRLLSERRELLVERLEGLAEPICLLCAERDPARCHRSIIADHLTEQGWTVTHIG